MTVIQKPQPPLYFDARQVQRITETGSVKFDDGSETTYGANGAVTTPTGAVIPTAGEWVITQQDAINTPEAGYGQPDPSPSPAIYVVTNAAFIANWQPI